MTICLWTRRITQIAAVAAAVAYGTALLGTPTSSGVYTMAQAERGEKQYGSKCAACHGRSLAGEDAAPPLAGARFLASWSGQSASDLTRRIRSTMPLDDPGSLDQAATIDLVAYILRANNFRAGNMELPTNSSQLGNVEIDNPRSRR